MAKALNPDAFNDWVYDRIDDYSHRLEVYCGGAGSGKSYGACQKVLLKALNHPRKVLVIRKVGATLRHSVFQLFLDLLSAGGLLDMAKVNRSDFQISLANGSHFIFKGLDDPEKIKSITGITDIVIEEATELSEEDFLQLNLRLRPAQDDPQIYLMFNPVSRANWVYRYFFEQPPPGARIVRTTYRDNRFLTDAYRQELEALQKRNPAYYRIYALGEFATLDKLVYPCVTKRRIAPEEYAGARFFCGLDFGYVNDPSALVWGRYDGFRHRVYILGEYIGEHLLNDKIAEAIKALGLAKEIITADGAEPKSIEEIRMRGVPRIRSSRKGADSLLHGIQWLNQQEILVDERCAGTIRELENYTWKKDPATGAYTNQPIDAFNHCLDALRYGLEHEIRPWRQPLPRQRLYAPSGVTARDMKGGWDA